jgi:predicted secreted Zn-dependent protease
MNLSKVIMAATAVASLLSFSFAQPAATESAPAKAKTPAITVHSISGIVESIDAIGNTVVVKTAKAMDTIKVDSATAITEKGKKISLADLKTGLNVSVSYKIAEGSKVAVSIKEKVKAAPAPAAAAPAAK